MDTGGEAKIVIQEKTKKVYQYFLKDETDNQRTRLAENLGQYDETSICFLMGEGF
jgi:hypothetical protein